MQYEERSFKTILIGFKYFISKGDSGVGKSNILLRYTKNEFSEHSQSTIGIHFNSKKLVVGTQAVTLSIWDTVGQVYNNKSSQDRYRALVKQFYQGTVGALLVYDITDRTSFDNLESWYKVDDTPYEQECVDSATGNIIFHLVGNKSDLSHLRKVEASEGAQFAEEHNMAFIETSAKSNENITQAFQNLVNEILRVYQKQKTLSDLKILQSQTQSEITQVSNQKLENPKKKQKKKRSWC